MPKAYGGKFWDELMVGQEFWTGGRTVPASYTPKHLAERILTLKTVLEGERKQVTVLFADLIGSMELLTDRDPEEARRLLDPVLDHMMEAMLPVLGTDNERVLRDVLGLSEGEFHALRAKRAMD